MFILHFTTRQLFEIKYFKLLTISIKNEFNQHCVMFDALAAFENSGASGYVTLIWVIKMPAHKL